MYYYDYKQDNMLLTDLYARDMSDALYMMFKDKLSKEEINKFVEEEVAANYKPAIGHWRNIYKSTDGTVDINYTLKDLFRDNSIICQNGGFIYDPEVLESPTSAILLQFIANRKKEKNIAMEYEAQGRYEEAKYKDNVSNTMKANTNSAYGIQLMRGSFLYNTDSASVITGQARELISEMLWSTEKFLMSNMAFDSINEVILHIKCTIQSELDDAVVPYLDYTPTVDDCMERFMFITETIPTYNSHIIAYLPEIEQMMRNFSEKERILFYYKNNFLDFVLRNSKVIQIFRNILESPVEYYNPYKIPEEFKADFDLLIKLFDEFVINPILTHDRVNKYLTRQRKTVLVSDTDSIMPNLNKQIELLKKLVNNVDFDDESVMFKAVNIITNLCTRVCDTSCVEYCRSCNTPEKYHDRINMKNEFYFQRLIMYADQKKNYCARKRMREGHLIPDDGQLASTGRALTAASINPVVAKIVNEILEFSILKAKNIDPIDILSKINILENHIKECILNGDKTFGLLNRFGGEKNYKDVETINIARTGIIWNRLYPLYPLQAGDMMYTFKTFLEKPEDCSKIQDLEMRAKVLDLVFDYDKRHQKEFKDQDFARFGLKEFSVPKIGFPNTIPEWILPFIDINKLVIQHTQSIISLLPSIGIEKSKVDSTKTIKSALVSF